MEMDGVGAGDREGACNPAGGSAVSAVTTTVSFWPCLHRPASPLMK